jgi:DNA-binding NarL/FixJ family response regulator
MVDTRILLADDHALVRAGFRALIGSLSDVQVVAEAEDGRKALQLVREHVPNIVLMDISMPELNGLDATEQIMREYPRVKVIILSMHTSEEYVLQALDVGASGYLLKDADLSELELALRSVVRGEIYLSPAVSKHVIRNYLDRTGERSATSARISSIGGLTFRQREVLQLIAEGYTSQDIAEQLFISVKTVEKHRYQIMERLDIHNIAGLVRYAVEQGLVKSS